MVRHGRSQYNHGCRCELCTRACRDSMADYVRKNPEYQAAANAKQRCDNPKNKAYKNYGGRGIKYLLTGWKDIINAIGRRPLGMELDRINNDGHYEVGNIRWTTRSENSKNRRVWQRTIPE